VPFLFATAIGSQKFLQVATELRTLAFMMRNLLPCLQGGSSPSSPHPKINIHPHSGWHFRKKMTEGL
jgi:hypothetical protein